jgi:hypothetical protein
MPTDEDQPTKLHSPYGVTKPAGEHLCSAYGNNFGVAPKQATPDIRAVRLSLQANSLVGHRRSIYGLASNDKLRGIVSVARNPGIQIKERPSRDHPARPGPAR